MQNEWTEREDEQLRSMWGRQDGHGRLIYSCREMAGIIGRSKSAIIGRANRIGLPRLQRAAKKKAAPRKIRDKRFVPRVFPKSVHKPIPLFVPAPLNLTILERQKNQCAYIEGDDGLCCGHQTASGSAWCEFHYQLVYRRIDERQRERSPLQAAE